MRLNRHHPWFRKMSAEYVSFVCGKESEEERLAKFIATEFNQPGYKPILFQTEACLVVGSRALAASTGRLATIGIWPSEWRPPRNVQRRIVCAAVLLLTKGNGRLIAGPRHFDAVMRAQIRPDDEWDYADAVQGFVDQFGCFLTRTEAWMIAEHAGQIRARCGGDTADGGTLYSENLY